MNIAAGGSGNCIGIFCEELHRPLLYFSVLQTLQRPVFARDTAPQNLVLQWDDVALRGVLDTKAGAMAARALAVVHTCMSDAWAAYDDLAIGTELRGALRRPSGERSLANKQRAISYAAYRALVDVLPADTEAVYDPLMHQLGFDPNDKSTDIETPTGIGNVACAAVLEARLRDKSNQLGEMDSAAADNAERNGVKKLNAIGAYDDPSSLPRSCGSG